MEIDINKEAESVAKGFRLFSQPRSDLVEAIACLCVRVRDEAEIAAVDAVMRHDAMVVNESLRKAIAKDVRAAIRNDKGVTNG